MLLALFTAVAGFSAAEVDGKNIEMPKLQMGEALVMWTHRHVIYPYPDPLGPPETLVNEEEGMV